MLRPGVDARELLAVICTKMLAVVGVRSAPGVMIVPLQCAFGWNVGTIPGALSPNILLMGLTGPFLIGRVETIGLRRTILLAILVLARWQFRALRHCHALAVVSDIGTDDRRRPQGPARWGWRPGRQSLVRDAAWTGHGVAGRGERGAIAAADAGAVRGLTGSQMWALLTSGLACLLASPLVLHIAGAPAVVVAAEWVR